MPPRRAPPPAIPAAGLALLLVLGAADGSARAGTVVVASQQAGVLTRLGAREAGAAIPVEPIPVEAGPAQVAAGPDGRLYLTHPDRRAVTVVEGARVLRRFDLPAQPFGIAVSGDGASLFVGDWAGGRVLRLSAGSGTVTGSVAVGREPAALVLDARGRLYAADRESRQVSVVDTATMTRIATVPVGEAPFALALSPAQDRLYVANVRSGDLSVLDTATLTSLATVPVGAMPYGVAATPDGSRVLVTNQQAGTVTVLDAGTLSVLGKVQVGKYPEGIAIDSGAAYVADWFSDAVSVVDLASLTESARIPVGEGPRSLAVLPALRSGGDAGARP
ncbi:YncE family protein [Methylobacterium sp. sgz302541]|uniref:YncE family protein n=1 Tax=unclassified Methylobacterium TaxID=2615210 RepID=UPI003D32CE26